MDRDDVGLKLCQQHVIKLDFEIKAVIQVCLYTISFMLLYVVNLIYEDISSQREWYTDGILCRNTVSLTGQTGQ